MPVPYTVQDIGTDPDQQVAATVATMARYAREDAAGEVIQQQARQAMVESSVPGNPLVAVWDYVKARMTFRHDVDVAREVHGRNGHVDMPDIGDIVEVLHRPRDIAAYGAGDCDDYATWGASLLLAMGVPVRIVTVAADAADPTAYSHVYLAAYPPNSENVRVPMDLSHGQAVGWETPNQFGKLTEWPVSAAAEGVHFIGVAIALAGVWYGIKSLSRRAA